MLLFMSMTPLSLFAATRHGCAPLTPPSVSGSLILPPAQYDTLLINEVLTLPHSTWNCSESGVYTPINDAWVEVYNPQNQPFDLYAVHTNLDSGPNTDPFYFPFGSAIAAHGYLVVFPRTSAAFLSTEGTTLRLVIDGTVIDELALPPLGEDQSYARIPDGGSTWQITSNPTIDTSNAPAQHNTPTPTLSNNVSGYGNGGSYTSITNTTDRQTRAEGTQPGWNTLQLPTRTSSTLDVSPSPGGATPSTQPGDNMDIPHKILFTLLLVALALTLLWSWRLFTTS